MKKDEDFGFVRLPNNLSLIPAVISYAGAVAEIIGFTHVEVKRIQLALEEACLDVLNNSFIPDEESEFDVKFFKRLDGIEIHVHDMGLPYDPSIAPVYDPSGNLLEQDLEGLGSFLIKKTMDEYRFNNLGIKGKEVVLIKYFDSPYIKDELDIPLSAEIVKPPDSKAPVEQINFDIRLMKPNEALEVCRCIYDCYGYSYANENIYYPERVVAMNQERKLLSALAVTPDGEIGGHFALIYYSNLPAEVGIAVTKKKFRGQGFARQLGEFLEMEARKDGLRGLQIKEVTAHPYTQKFCIKLGYKDCGLLLAHSPQSLSFKGIADTLKQRNSDVLGFKYLVPPEPRKIYAPERHKEMILTLFNNIGDDIECVTDGIPTATKEQCVTEVKVHSLRSLAEINIKEIGQDTIPVLRQEMRKLFIDKIEVFELYLSLNDPMAPVIVPQLENLGFIFTGILPETALGDAIIMQYFNGVHIEYDLIVLVTDVAKQLLEYIKKNDPHTT